MKESEEKSALKKMPQTVLSQRQLELQALIRECCSEAWQDGYDAGHKDCDASWGLGEEDPPNEYQPETKNPFKR